MDTYFYPFCIDTPTHSVTVLTLALLFLNSHSFVATCESLWLSHVSQLSTNSLLAMPLVCFANFKTQILVPGIQF